MDDLTYVRDRLERSVGRLRKLANQTGIAYDTLLRIKNAEGDPGYSKVLLLAQFFRADDKRARKGAS